MEKQLDMHAIGRDRHWLNIAESLAVIGSVGGSVAAIFLQEIVLVSIPLSACIVLNLFNRKRFLNLITTENNKAIAILSQQTKNDYGNLGDQIIHIEQSITNGKNKSETDYQHLSQQLTQIEFDSKKQIKELKSQDSQLSSKIAKIVKSTTSSSAELYYQNAAGYQQMGEKEKAIEEYTRAIQIDKKYAEAYVNRGLLVANLGKKQSAIEDLRQAAKLYFERGDLDNYQLIKQKTKDLHQLKFSSFSNEETEQVSASSLFS